MLHVELTDDAYTLQRDALPVQFDMGCQICATLTEDERAVLVDLLGKLEARPCWR